MITKEHFSEHYELSQAFRKQCAENIAWTARVQVEELKRRLPKFIFIGSLSVEYHCPSQEDWLLKVLYYDTDYHKLSAATIQFAVVEYDGDISTFSPLLSPEVLEVEDLDWDAWLYLSDTLFPILGELRRNIACNKPCLPARHKETNHPLIPVFEILKKRGCSNA